METALLYVWSGCVLSVRSLHTWSAGRAIRVEHCYKPPMRLPARRSRTPLRACWPAATREATDRQPLLQTEEDRPSLSSTGLELSTSKVDVHLLSPMMQHYVFTKRTVRDSLDSGPDRNFILMYRVGDFFESFFEDAHILSRVCEVALTSKDSGKALGKRVPMAGVPHHCLDEKIRTLLESNVTVVVVDQVQSAASVTSGKLVERAVTRVITPGTACDQSLLNATVSSYLASIVIKPSMVMNPKKDMEVQSANGNMNIYFGFSYADTSTGEFMATESYGTDALRRLLTTVSPVEVLLVVPPSFEDTTLAVQREIKNAGVGVISRRESLPLETAQQLLSGFHGVDDVESIGCKDMPLCTQAAALLLNFIGKTIGLQNECDDSLLLNKLVTFSMSDNMLLDGACLKNLEILETVRDGVKERSLQSAVDRTATVMGARCLRVWLVSPPLCLETILQRQKIIESLVKDKGTTATKMQRVLRGLSDLERSGGRLIHGRTTPRELQSLCESILQIPSVIDLLRVCIEKQMSQDVNSRLVQSLLARVDTRVLALARKIFDALVNPAPSSLPSHLSLPGSAAREGFTSSRTQIFRTGYNPLLDKLREQLGPPENWITAIEDKERARTAIDTLRVKHIKNLGYVVRIPRSTGENIMNEDPTFFRRLGYEQVQSTKVELRFRFEDLLANETEFHVGFAQILAMEQDMYEELRSDMRRYVRYMRSLGSRIAQIDVLAGLAKVALEQHYVKPTLLPQSHRVLEFEDIRHPVVEQTMPSGKTFVPNSFCLGHAEGNTYPDVMILCGPNAAGKSCSLRSVGLIVILAQIGSFVPARCARLSICDRIFTRVGAVDDLSRGQSTFQVEMAETACILSHATSSSLVLLDEVGRGTSAVDGVAIAWSVSEFLALHNSRPSLPPRSIFVTHYHELNHLSELHSNVQSFHMHVEESPPATDAGIADGNEWVATYTIAPGPSYDSFGITIAKRAGLPRAVIERAYEVSKLLRLPSQDLGTELRRHLVRNGETAKEDSRRVKTEEGAGAGWNGIHEEKYLSGYEHGYRAALAEVHGNFENIMARLGSQQVDKGTTRLKRNTSYCGGDEPRWRLKEGE